MSSRAISKVSDAASTMAYITDSQAACEARGPDTSASIDNRSVSYTWPRSSSRCGPVHGWFFNKWLCFGGFCGLFTRGEPCPHQSQIQNPIPLGPSASETKRTNGDIDRSAIHLDGLGPYFWRLSKDMDRAIPRAARRSRPRLLRFCRCYETEFGDCYRPRGGLRDLAAILALFIDRFDVVPESTATLADVVVVLL